MGDIGILSREALLAAKSLEEDTASLKTYTYLIDKKTGKSKQKLFHLSSAPIKGILGANKSGKSYPGTAEFCMHVTGIYPDWYPEHLRMKGCVRGRIIVNDFGAMYKEDMERYLEKWIPKWMYTTKGGYRKKNNEGAYVEWHLSNEYKSHFHIMSNKQEADTFEGAEIDLLLINEPCSRDKFIASTRGMITSGFRIIFVLTPLKGSAWIIDEIVPREDAFFQFVDIRENPTLSEERIKLFESTLTEDEIEARIHGRPQHLLGRIYKTFDRRVHCIPRYKIPPTWNRYLILDPHERVPFAFLWGAVNPKHQIIWYDYLWQGDKTIEEYSQIIKAKEGNDKITKRIMDVHYLNKPLIEGERRETLGEAFERYGLHFEGCNPDFTLGRLMVMEYLKYDTQKPITAFNEAAMYWFSDLKEPIYQMEHYTWDEWSSGVRDKKDPKERPKEKNSHFPDTVRYLAVERPKYLPPLPLKKPLPKKRRRYYGR